MASGLLARLPQLQAGPSAIVNFSSGVSTSMSAALLRGVELVVSNSPSCYKCRYCSSVGSSIPIAAAMPVALFGFVLLARLERLVVVADAPAALRALRRAIEENVLPGILLPGDHVGLAAAGLHCVERPELVDAGLEPFLDSFPAKVGMACAVLFEPRLQYSEQLLLARRWQSLLAGFFFMMSAQYAPLARRRCSDVSCPGRTRPGTGRSAHGRHEKVPPRRADARRNIETVVAAAARTCGRPRKCCATKRAGGGGPRTRSGEEWARAG
jgi:hypothetical protein